MLFLSFPFPVWVTHKWQSLRDVPAPARVTHGCGPSDMFKHAGLLTSPSKLVPRCRHGIPPVGSQHWAACKQAATHFECESPRQFREEGLATARCSMVSVPSVWGLSPLGLFIQLCSWRSIPTDRSLPPHRVFLASLFFFPSVPRSAPSEQAKCGSADLGLYRWSATFGQVSLEIAIYSSFPPPPEPWADQLLRTALLISSVTFEVMLSPFIFQFHYSIAERYLHVV